MKKLLLLFTALALSLSTSLFAESIFSKPVETVKQKTGAVLAESEVAGSVVCPVYENTPIEQVKRKPFDFEARWNFLDMPKQGNEEFNLLTNFDLMLTHNLSRSFFVYTYYGQKKYNKTEYSGSEYGTEWTARYIFGGLGIYIHPTFKFYGGMSPYFEFKDENGNKPKLDTPVEFGAAYDIPVHGNKLVLGLRQVRAPQKSEGDDIQESQGDAGFTTVSVSYSMPIGW